MLGKVPFLAFRSNLQKAVGGKLTDPTYEVARMGFSKINEGQFCRTCNGIAPDGRRHLKEMAYKDKNAMGQVIMTLFDNSPVLRHISAWLPQNRD